MNILETEMMTIETVGLLLAMLALVLMIYAAAVRWVYQINRRDETLRKILNTLIQIRDKKS